MLSSVDRVEKEYNVNFVTSFLDDQRLVTIIPDANKDARKTTDTELYQLIPTIMFDAEEFACSMLSDLFNFSPGWQ